MENPANLAQGNWLKTVNYYDEKGRIVQVQSDNCKKGKDTITSRHDFTGKVITTYPAHSAAKTNDLEKNQKTPPRDQEGWFRNPEKTM